MTDKNVVNFPGQNAKVQDAISENNPVPNLTPEQMKEKIQEGQKFAMEVMEKNRKEGLEKADKALINLDEVKGIAEDSAIEARLRALESGLRGLVTGFDGLNKLTDLIKHDLINSLTSMQNITEEVWRKSAHLQTLLQVLKEKNLISEDELKETWDKIVPSMVEAMKNTKGQ